MAGVYRLAGKKRSLSTHCKKLRLGRLSPSLPALFSLSNWSFTVAINGEIMMRSSATYTVTSADARIFLSSFFLLFFFFH